MARRHSVAHGRCHSFRLRTASPFRRLGPRLVLHGDRRIPMPLRCSDRRSPPSMGLGISNCREHRHHRDLAGISHRRPALRSRRTSLRILLGARHREFGDRSRDHRSFNRCSFVPRSAPTAISRSGFPTLRSVRDRNHRRCSGCSHAHSHLHLCSRSSGTWPQRDNRT